MRNLKFILPLLTLAALVGCATFQSNAGKILASSALTVDAAMKGWAVWVAKGQATSAQEATVKAAYQKYQASMALASGAYTTAATSSDKTAWDQAIAVLKANEAALVNLISQFEKITP